MADTLTEQPDIEADAPEENSVAEAADAIAELLKKKPQEDEGEAAVAATPQEEKPAADPGLEAMKAHAMRAAQEAEYNRQHYAAALHQMVPQLEQSIRGEFADIKSPADMVRLAQENPARYNRLVAAQGQFAQAQAARAQLAQQEQLEAQARQAAWQADQSQKLKDMLPDLHDPQKARQMGHELGVFAGKMGYTKEQFAQASATDIALLHRAMQFDGLGAAQEVARAKAARAPRVFEPGARSEAANRLQSDFERLKKSGTTQDAAAVFQNFLK